MKTFLPTFLTLSALPLLAAGEYQATPSATPPYLWSDLSNWRVDGLVPDALPSSSNIVWLDSTELTPEHPFILDAAAGAQTISVLRLRQATLRLEAGASLKMASTTNACFLGDKAGQHSILELETDSAITNSGAVYLANGGTAAVTNRGGSFVLTLSGKNLIMGNSAGSRGTYTQTSGALSVAADCLLGVNGDAEVQILGGTAKCKNLYLGTQSGNGTLLTQVPLSVSGTIKVANGQLTLAGDATNDLAGLLFSTGTVRLQGGTLRATSTTVRPNLQVATNGLLTGYGKVINKTTADAYASFALSGGRVAADGGELSLNTVIEMANTLDSETVSGSGWYAVNGGSVLMPCVYLPKTDALSDVSVALGTDAGKEHPDLVGACRIALRGKASNRDAYLRGGLLALDHPEARLEAHPTPEKVFQIWRFGLFLNRDTFTLDKCATFTDASIEFCFDDSAVGPSDRLVLHRLEGGKWVRVATVSADSSGRIALSSPQPSLDGELYNLGTYALSTCQAPTLILVY
ncbi:MAG: hypothetical protein ACI4X9_07585 [Kiritimatiellia bacterium]